MQPFLSVPGASVYYNVTGIGPLLLLIPSANGDESLFKPLVPHMSSSFKVCTYDRRGYSQSPLSEPLDNDPRQQLARDADDAAALIQRLSPDRPALVFGSGGGARVAMELLTRHPDLVQTVIAHEPPAFDVLDENLANSTQSSMNLLYNVYKSQDNIQAAIEGWALQTGNEEDRRCLRAAMLDPSRDKDVRHWLQYEFRRYAEAPLNLRVLQSCRAKLVMATGSSSRSVSILTATNNISRHTGAALIELPGGHVGYCVRSEDFARSLSHVLAE